MRQYQSHVEPVSCVGSRRILPIMEPPSALHRIAEVMRQEGVSMRNMATRLGSTETIVVKESHPECDMLLSDLFRWQAALRVPVAELLPDSGDPFSPPVLLRSSLLKLMRSVRSIQKHSKESSIKTFVDRLSEQLMEMMPELEKVEAWPTTGQRREPHELGAITDNVVPAHLFNNMAEEE